jgi:hypothetical protein
MIVRFGDVLFSKESVRFVLHMVSSGERHRAISHVAERYGMERGRARRAVTRIIERARRAGRVVRFKVENVNGWAIVEGENEEFS